MQVRAFSLHTYTYPNMGGGGVHRAPRACRACENCRKRKVRCSGGEICRECQRFQTECVYREHYRTRKEFSIKILQSPDFERVRSRKQPRVTVEEADDEEVEEENGEREGPSPPVTRAQPEVKEYVPTFLEQLYKIVGELEPASGLENKVKRVLDLSHAAANAEPVVDSRHLTEEQMLQYVADYFNAYYVILPFFDPDTWIRKAKTAWRAADDEVTLSESLDLAIVYMLIALGSCGSFSASFSGFEDSVWSRVYAERARKIVPNPFERPPSLRLLQYLAVITLHKMAQNNFSEAYMYSGLMVRNAVVLGLHLVDPAEDYEKHRAWYSVYIFEKYWGFAAGRPSSIGLEYPPPIPHPPAFHNNSIYAMSTEHCLIRLRLCDLSIKFLTYSALIGSNKAAHQSITKTLQLVVDADNQLEQIIQSSKDPHLKAFQINPDFTDIQCREWYWIRLFYWFIKLILYRPFLFTSHYFGLPQTHIPSDTLNSLAIGTQRCLEAALAIPPIVAEINSRLERCQLNWFSNTYLECASVVFILYCASLASNNQAPPQSVLQAMCRSYRHMNGCRESKLQDLTIELLQDQSFLAMLGENRQLLVKCFFGVSMDPPTPNEDLDAVWNKTLRLIGFQVIC